MDTYYHPHDLSKFGDMGKDAPELWKKFNEWYTERTREGTDRTRRGTCRAVSVLHRCLYDGIARKGIDT